MLQFITGRCKIQRMRESAVEGVSWTLQFVADQYKTRPKKLWILESSPNFGKFSLKSNLQFPLRLLNALKLFLKKIK